MFARTAIHTLYAPSIPQFAVLMNCQSLTAENAAEQVEIFKQILHMASQWLHQDTPRCVKTSPVIVTQVEWHAIHAQATLRQASIWWSISTCHEIINDVMPIVEAGVQTI